MSNIIPIIAGLLVMISYGTSDVIAKHLTTKLEKNKIIFYRGLVISLIYLPFLFIFWDTVNFNWLYILILIGIAFFGFLGLSSFYQALGRGKLGVVVPIAGLDKIITVFLSVLLFRESFGYGHLGVLAIIFTGFLFISIRFKDFKGSELFKLSSGIPNALFTCLLWGIVYTVFKYPVGVLGPILTSIVLEFFISFYMGIKKKIDGSSFKTNWSEMKSFFYLALCGASATFFYMYGISNGNVSIVVLASSGTPLIPALYGRFFGGERLTRNQYIGLVLLVVGLVLVTQL